MIICISSEKKSSVRQPSISPENRETVRSFVQSPDISHSKTGWSNTIYCWKNQQGKKEYILYDSIYRSRNYLLWSFKEILQLFHPEADCEISYHTVNMQLICCKQWRIHIGNQKRIRWWLQLTYGYQSKLIKSKQAQSCIKGNWWHILLRERIRSLQWFCQSSHLCHNSYTLFLLNKLLIK